MIFRRLRRTLLIGLGTVAGAVLPSVVPAQVPVRRDTVRSPRDTTPTRVDSARARQVRAPEGRDTIRVPTPARADSMVKNDSIIQGIVPLPPGAKRDSTKRDTLKAPLSRAEAPPILEIGAPHIYDRTAMFATGALTLSDLLGRVPGLTEFTTGWLGAPTVVASQGDLRRIRVFLDGLELDPLGRRAQGVSSVSDLPLHALEELRIERGADEVRVHARSWRVERTNPYTRADIATGDQNTNLYRAWFGRRYDHGEALQLAAEQYSTQPDRRLASSGGLHLMGRFGLTRGPWSTDLFAERSDVDRAAWVGTGSFADTRDTVAALQTRRTTAYVRVGNGEPDRGRWVQLLAAAEAHQGIPRRARSSSSTSDDTPDTTAYENQFVLTGGASLYGVRVSAAERVRVASGRTSHVLSLRAGMERPWLGASAFLEGQSALHPARAEGTVKLSPFGRIAVTASASRTGGGKFSRVFGDFQPTPLFNADGTFTLGSVAEFGGLYDSTRVARYELAARTSLRAEAGVKLREVWVSGGVVRRGATTLLPPAEFLPTYARARALRVEPEAIGSTVALRGRLYRAINVDAWAIRWNDSTGLYRPQYQTRSELYLQTNLLNRFPRGNFGLLGSLAHEYRSNARFATSGDSVRVAQGFRSVAFKLEIRIQTAVVSYQFRNLLQEKYAQVPGFFMPRQTQFYGVRWDFWN
ncbi:MAG TPA: Plug domain-containing protein [Gemmatimonadaceae bacterium]|nr:Plug domain-containing protein [Gemmatimonadaceae bacterium]